MLLELPELPYRFDALEPHIDAKTMEIHYTKHHQTYIDKLAAALEGYKELQAQELEEILVAIDTVPTEIRQVVINHGGGHANHTLFWESMHPADEDGTPAGNLLNALLEEFGTVDSFKEEFSTVALGHFGSGWAWLVKHDNSLQIISTPNQDSPLMQGFTPLLGLDVWEHAYYLAYQNRRADYIAAWWNVVNWPVVQHRFDTAV